MTTDPKKRGFAAMDPDRQRFLASKGGTTAHERGSAHQWSAEEARQAGVKGGLQVSRDREHMSRIGALGGRMRAEGLRPAEKAPDRVD